MIAFWAITEKPVVQSQPGADTHIEAIVLVRHEAGSDIVYPFSFVDIGMALSFVQYEMGRGLDPNLVLLYWAVPVQLVITGEGDVTLSPATAPAISAGAIRDCRSPEPKRRARADEEVAGAFRRAAHFVSTAG